MHENRTEFRFGVMKAHAVVAVMLARCYTGSTTTATTDAAAASAAD